MMYPLVRELAAKDAPIRVPVTVTCRVLKIARQPYYRWLAGPVTDADLVKAYRANALFDAHRDDPEFGYRFLVDEAGEAGESMAARTAWRICSQLGWFSAFGKPKRGKAKKPGAPVHDDLCAVIDNASRNNSTACRNDTPWAVITQSIGPPPRRQAPRQCHKFLAGVTTSDGESSSWNGHFPIRSLPCERSSTPQPSTSRCTDTSALIRANSPSGMRATPASRKIFQLVGRCNLT